MAARVSHPAWRGGMGRHDTRRRAFSFQRRRVLFFCPGGAVWHQGETQLGWSLGLKGAISTFPSVSATSESPCEPCGRPPLARCAGFGAVRVAVRRCRLREDPSGGPLDALRRRGTRLRLAAARHGTGLVTADGDIAARAEPERDPDHPADRRTCQTSLGRDLVHGCPSGIYILDPTRARARAWWRRRRTGAARCPLSTMLNLPPRFASLCLASRPPCARVGICAHG